MLLLPGKDFFILIVYMRKLRLKEVYCLAQGKIIKRQKRIQTQG